MKPRLNVPSVAVVLVVLAVLFAVSPAREWVIAKLSGSRTVDDVVRAHGEPARDRLEPAFAAADVPYPPPAVTLAVLKDTKTLELWAGTPGELRLVKQYPVLAASGQSGPKLKEGDHQVPEGIYAVESLNPNSRYHLALRVNYPNEFDRERAARDGRSDLGGDIMIHGSNVSVGCLAMGDPAIEELFVLAVDAGIENVAILIAPTDPRKRDLEPAEGDPAWVSELYEQISAAFGELRADRS